MQAFFATPVADKCDFRYGSLADIAAALPNVRFTPPESGHLNVSAVASTIWTLARFMLAAGWVDDYQVHYNCIGVLPAALLYALRVINECKCLLDRLGYHPDLLSALIYAR
jgi:hypothetical protein